ncbi:hypothetical protein M422DRAFT_46325 [Sphaerobolus stellatus SS14]|uniref:Cytochrome P450 n=1 Tax=Sphaerobolus stellatus (strain SS14) TaxID=990650 RepID=A0A0C9VG78_SPHS4|nr:hypothetical protein M422DRAFT_46325 [Sphaerobolus stellatus SS14]
MKIEATTHLRVVALPTAALMAFRLVEALSTSGFPDIYTSISLLAGLGLAITLIIASFNSAFISITTKQPGFEFIEPPTIPTWIPWLGHALSYRSSPATFLKRCSQRYGPVYKFLAGGKYLVVISHPITISNLLRDRSKTIGIFDFQFLHKVTGIKDMTRMPHIYSHLVGVILTHPRKALSERHLGDVAASFNEQLFLILPTFLHGSEEMTFGVTDFVRRSLFPCTTMALLGHPFVDHDMYEDFFAFDDAAPQIIQKASFSGRLSAEDARDRIVQKLSSCVQQHWRDEDGGYLEGAEHPFISEIVRSMKAGNLTEDEMGRLLMSWMWGAHSNVIRVSIWLINYILTDDVMRETIRNEVLAGVEKVFSDIGSFIHDDPRCFDPNHFPFLNSAIKETLRIISLPSSARTVLEDTVLEGHDGQPIRLHKGEIIMADITSMHYNQQYFEDPHTFKFDRFVKSKGDTIFQQKVFLPFGSGTHVCIGRHYAQHVIRVFMISLFHFYDIGPGIGSSRLPPVDPKSFLTLLHSDKDLSITIRRHHEDRLNDFLYAQSS